MGMVQPKVPQRDLQLLLLKLMMWNRREVWMGENNGFGSWNIMNILVRSGEVMEVLARWRVDVVETHGE